MTVPVVLIAPVLATAVAPIVVPPAAALDLVTAPKRMTRSRAIAMVWCYTLLEAAAAISAGAVWVQAGFGRHLASPASFRRSHRLQRWWVGAILGAAARTTGLRLDIEGLEECRDGPLVVLGRHACIADSTLPAQLFANLLDRPMRMLIKSDLIWLPSLDVVGHRLRNHFVDRDPAHRESELAAVAALADDLGPRDSLCIFPEGTYRSPRSWLRALERLDGAAPDRAQRLRGLEQLLPPRPGGTIALLEATPTADVVILGHVGLEGLWSMRELLHRIPFAAPIGVKLWRIPRADVPNDRAGMERWLDDRWLELDRWVTETLAQRRART